MHKITELYKTLYHLGYKLPKRDRFGIHLKIEQLSLEIFELSILAALETKMNKTTVLNKLRLKLEVLKRLVRALYELNIVEKKNYLSLESNLIEISKMTNGWLRYLIK